MRSPARLDRIGGDAINVGPQPAPPPAPNTAEASDSPSEPAPVDRPLIYVQALGAARITVGDQIIDQRAQNTFALLVRLIFSPGMATSRFTLVDEIWPGQTLSRQRANLRQALYKLRGIGIDIGKRGDHVRLNPKQVAPTFSITREASTFEQEVLGDRRPFGLFLQGYTDHPYGFDQWVENTRQTVHSDVRRTLVEVLRSKREQVDWATVELVARHLLVFDPLNEDATLALAECTMLSGAKAEAVAILDRYLAELGPGAGDIQLPAQLLRRRFAEQRKKRRNASEMDLDRHFVGREEELTSLTQAMRRARWNDGGAVLLHGSPGIGKSRLVTQLSKAAQIDGLAEILIECREADRGRPLSALIDCLPQLLNSTGVLGASPENIELVRSLASERPAIAQSSYSLAGMSADEFAATAAAQAPITRDLAFNIRPARAIRDAVIDIISAAADERPLLLVAEDVHWMDLESWEVLAHLLGRIRNMRVFVLATSRQRNVPSHLHNSIFPILKAIHVAALSRGACQELVRAISDDYSTTMGDTIEQWIVTASEGNPLALRLLVNHWLETGEMDAPPTLLALVQNRIDRLHPQALRVMQVVCLLGRLASVERIRKVLELPSHELLHAFEQLEQDECLSRSEARLIAAHELLGRACLERLTKLAGIAMHSAIASVLRFECERAPAIDILLGILSHLKDAGDVEQCVMTSLKYKSELLQFGRPQAVLQTFEGLDVSGAGIEAARQFNSLLARLKLESGEYARALTHISRGWPISADVHHLTNTDADELLSLADSAYRADTDADRDHLGGVCCDIAQSEHLSDTVRVRASEIGLTIAANTCDPAIAEGCFSVVERLREAEGTDARQNQRLTLLYHTVFGDLDIAELTARAILGESLAAVPSSVVAQDIGRAAYALRIAGRLGESLDAFEQAYRMALAVEAPKLALYPAWQLAQIHLDSGNELELRHWLGHMEQLYSVSNSSTTSHYLVAFYCQVALYAGDLAAAAKYLQITLETMPRVPARRAASHITGLAIGVALMERGQSPDQTLIDTAINLHAAVAHYGTSDLLTATICESFIRQGDIRRANKFIDHYLYQMRRERAPITVYLARTEGFLQDTDSSKRQQKNELSS